MGDCLIRLKSKSPAASLCADIISAADGLIPTRNIAAANRTQRSKRNCKRTKDEASLTPLSCTKTIDLCFICRPKCYGLLVFPIGDVFCTYADGPLEIALGSQRRCGNDNEETRGQEKILHQKLPNWQSRNGGRQMLRSWPGSKLTLDLRIARRDGGAADLQII